ncbi:AbrB/MazE/SpoVT family DNA-binding domain-containing protein [Nocardia sp. CA-120079]|uniref:AbrB/MazE/SpoVT family DNA-binding domain-containing protein n=1 Tax=Nocardia sp. CA-120079 TaxID=3239974 RepID=UPI003D97B3A8
MLTVSIINDRARLSGQRVFAEMGWPAGYPITYSVAGNLVAIRTAQPEAAQQKIGRLGQIRLPATVRRATGITFGDALLLIGLPSIGVVAVIPSRVVHEALSSALTNLQGDA